MYSYVNSFPCLGCEPIDAGVEYPDVQEEEFEEQAPTGGEGVVDYYMDFNEQANYDQ